MLDENVDIRIASVLKNHGYSVSVCPKGITNGELFSLAKRKGCVLITNDKDFANPDLHNLVNSPGVVVLRIHPPSVENTTEAMEKLLSIFSPVGFIGKLLVVNANGVEIIE